MQQAKKLLALMTAIFAGVLLFQLKYTKHYGDLVANYYSSSVQNEDPAKLKVGSPPLKSKRSKPSIFCYISTAPKYLETRAIAVNNTWARLCDKYFFITSIYHDQNNVLFSNRTIETYDPLPILQVAGMKVENYSAITDKIYGAYKYIYATYPDYDWYMKADDDTFVFVDNLRSFLSKKDPKDKYTYGYNLDYMIPGGYHSGGAGMAIGNRALKAIGRVLTKNNTFCPNTGVDDMDLNICLRHMGFVMGESRDEIGRERFHPLHAMSLFRKGHIPKWIYSFAINVPIKDGAECCSDETTSFHYATPEQMYLLQNLWDKYKAEKGLPFNFTELLIEAEKAKEFI